MPFSPPGYTPFTWQDFPSTATPLSAANLISSETSLSGYTQTALAAYDAYAQGQYVSAASVLLPTGSDSAPLNTALAAAVTSGGVIQLGAGTFTLSTLVSQTFNNSVPTRIIIRGAGVGSTILTVNDINGGLKIDGTGTALSRQSQIIIEDLSVVTSLAGAAFGISVPISQGGAQHQRSLIFRNVQVTGSSSTTGYYTNPVILTGHWRPRIENVVISGPWNGTDAVAGHPSLQNDISDASAMYYQQVGLTLDGCYKPDASNVYVWSCALGISHSSVQSGMEGGSFAEMTVVGCKTGMYLHTPDTRGEFRVTGHFNNRDVNIDCNGRMLGWIEDILSYNGYVLSPNLQVGQSNLNLTSSPITADVPNTAGGGQTIPVTDCAQFDTSIGLCSIGNEQMTFTGRSVSSGAGNLTNVTRGVNGTTVGLHASGSICQMVLSSSQTTIPVTNCEYFQSPPYTKPTTVLISNEWITYTAVSTSSGAGNLTGCTRGANDQSGTPTTPSVHTASAPVFNVLSATTTSIPLDPTTTYIAYAGGGTIVLGNEIVTYTGVNFAATGVNSLPIVLLTGCTRGALSTTAFAHGGGAIVTVQLTRPTGSLTNSATTIPVGSTSGFPDQGLLLLDSEYIWYESKDSTNFKQCLRGAIGSTAASHTTSAVVNPVSVDFLIRGGSDAVHIAHNSHHFGANPNRVGVLVTGGYYANNPANISIDGNYFDTTMVMVGIENGVQDVHISHPRPNTTSTYGIGQTILKVLDDGTRTKYRPRTPRYALVKKTRSQQIATGTTTTLLWDSLQTDVYSNTMDSDGFFTTPTLIPTTLNTPGTSTSGGTLASATYFYVVTGLNAAGEGLASNEVSIATGAGSTNSNTLAWSAITGASSYNIYRGTSTGAENVQYNSGTNSFTDTGAAGPTISPPSALNSTQFVIPANNCIHAVRLTACIEWQSGTTGYRQVTFLRNGIGNFVGNVESSVSGQSASTQQTIHSEIIPVQAADTLRVQVNHTSGGALSVNGADQYITFGLEVIEGY